MRNDFRRPRAALLALVAEFFSTCLSRLEVQKTHLPETLKITASYFLDTKCHQVGGSFHYLITGRKFNSLFRMGSDSSAVCALSLGVLSWMNSRCRQRRCFLSVSDPDVK